MLFVLFVALVGWLFWLCLRLVDWLVVDVHVWSCACLLVRLIGCLCVCVCLYDCLFSCVLACLFVCLVGWLIVSFNVAVPVGCLVVC